MKNVKKRLHGYDPVFDRLDRKALIEHYQKYFVVGDTEDLQNESRSDLIDAILDAENETWLDTPDDPEDYPLRRLELEWDPATTLARKSGQRLYWSWEEDPLASAKSLVTDVGSYNWILAQGIRTGDLILTTLGSTPPLVVALEVAESVLEEEILVERLATFSNPISLLEIEERLDMSLPRSSQKLSASTADKVLGIIAELTADPRPIFVTAGNCSPYDTDEAHATLAVISLLQQGMVEDITCDACGRIDPSSLESHLFRPMPENILLEIQDHVDDTALLCFDCHSIAHRPSLQQLRDFTVPACPDCGERNPQSILWGMPAGPPSENEILGGCALPQGFLPQWSCRECGSWYAVVPYQDGLGLTHIDAQSNLMPE